METIVLDMSEDRQIVHIFVLDAKVAELSIDLSVSVIFMRLIFS